MTNTPVAFSASLPLWIKIGIGVVLGVTALSAVRYAARRPGPRWSDSRVYSRRDIAGPTLIAGGFLVALIAIALDVEFGGLITRTVDLPVHDWFVAHRNTAMIPLVTTMTNLVSPFGSTVLAIVLAVIVAFRTRSWMPALIIFIGPSTAGLAVRLVKLFAPRDRPPILDQVVLTVESSFPSGHVAGAASLYGCLVLVVLIGFFGPASKRRRWTVVGAAATATVLVAWTRLYLAVHWFTDVTASVLLAGAVVFGTLATYRVVVRRRPALG